MTSGQPHSAARAVAFSVLLVSAAAAAACGAGGSAVPASVPATRPASPAATARPPSIQPPGTSSPAGAGHPASALGSPLPAPAALAPFSAPAFAGEGVWRPAGRSVDGVPAVYETTLIPPGGRHRAGIAWLDTRLLAARLYSGSRSPGGGPYRYTAPIEPAQAVSLVAAFNGGFLRSAGGGYYTEGRTVHALRPGAASLVIYADGTVSVGAWGSDVVMTPNVVSVRQNLVPLVAGGRSTPQAASTHWRAWGATCGAASCAHSVPGIERQWRSGVGVTADGALVYATGPALDPLRLARLLVRAGVERGMQLDINPYWPVFVTYDPPTAAGVAAPANGSKLLSSTIQGPRTFFQPSWARDFITMSARPG